MLAARTGVHQHDVAVALGSGWAAAAAALGQGPEVALADLPGFPALSALGHQPVVASIRVGRRRVLMFRGRAHLYEGHPPATVVHWVRTAAAAGCTTIVLTNAAGSLRPEWPLGEPVLISDHINLTGRSPLVGPLPPPPHAGRFVDMTTTYTPALRDLARRVEPRLREGVYAGFLGPQFETPAEIGMARAIGADLVGMSTVLEAIAARHMGASVLGLSLVTNLAAGLSAGPVDGDEVLAAGAAAAEHLGPLLRRLLERLGDLTP